MSKRYLQWGYDSFKDTKTGEISDNHIHLLNKQAERIAELEEQLKNAIVPKFKFMKKVWHINKDYFYKKDWYVEELLINGFEYKIDKRKNALVMWYSTYFNDYKNYKYQEKDLFATKEEAEERLKNYEKL